MIGIVKSSLPDGRSLGPAAALEAASRQGLAGVLFNSLTELSPALDPVEMGEMRQEADRLGLYISSSLGVLNPALPARGQAILAAGDGDFEVGVRRLVTSAAGIGIHDLFFVIGMIEDRFDASVSWQAQRDAVAALVLKLGPLLRGTGSRLLVKTHEEITSTEVVALVRRVGSELLGIAFDPVNVVCRLEDPVEAARRVAPYTAQIHVDDAILKYEERGARRYLCPLGEGAIDWGAIDALMPEAHRWIEMHSGQFAMPVFDPAWLARQPEVALAELAGVMAMANRFGDRAVPWDQGAPTSRLPQAYERLLK